MSITIQIFKANPIFYPGEIITGKVTCIFNSRKHIRGIFLHLKGQEHTSWTEWENRYSSTKKSTETYSVHYSGDNTFLSLQLNLQAEGNIDIGNYEYHFQHVLPHNLPSTYKGVNGYIRFFLKANVEIPNAFDYKDKKIINVMSPINFNRILDQIILNPVQYQEESTRCCCCFNAGPITMEVYLPKKAFVIGEKVTMRIYMRNMSNDSIENVTVKVIRIVNEKAIHPRSKERTHRNTLFKVIDTGVGAHGDRNYNLELQIPPNLELPNFELCSLFTMWHILSVRGSVRGLRSDIKMETAITLGHIPREGSHLPYIIPVPSAPSYPSGNGLPGIHQPYISEPFSISGTDDFRHRDNLEEIHGSSSYTNNGIIQEAPPSYNEITKT